ncbi:MAG: hypothetical protein R2725_15760 [Solirubrobacterales bacterium]
MKRQLKRANCKLGKVIARGRTGKAKGRVGRQWPKLRTVRPPRAAVKVLLR